MHLPLLILLLIHLLKPAAAQRRQPPVSPRTYKGRVLIVGSGGGFAGGSVAYYLLDNGRLFGKRSVDTAYAELPRQSFTRTKRLFTEVEKNARVKTTRFNEPGNTYQFVGWQRGSVRHEVVWGRAGTTPPASYPRFYQMFMALIPPAAQLD